MTAKLGLHIGLPKTGTSSLQQLCFAHHPEIRYFGQSNLKYCDSAQIVLKALLLCETDRPPDHLVNTTLRDAMTTHPALMISDEALSFGGMMLRAKKWNLMADQYAVAERAHNLLGEAHVFIVVRNQVDWLESWHRQGLKNGNRIERRFDRWLLHEVGPRSERLFSMLNYDNLCTIYQNLFGADKVHVRLYEKYQSSFEDLAGEFANILGVDENLASRLMKGPPKNVSGTYYRSQPTFLLRMRRNSGVRTLLEKFPMPLRSRMVEATRIRKRYPYMSEEEKSAVRRRFENSNRSLMRRLSEDADGLGYF
jgi:hypothetical protein